MTLQLLLSHLISAAFGAALLWALRGRPNLRGMQDPAPATHPQKDAPAATDTRVTPDSTASIPERPVTSDAGDLRDLTWRLEQETEQKRRLLQRLSLTTKAAGVGIWDWDIRTDVMNSDGFISRAFSGGPRKGMPNARQFFIDSAHPDDRDSLIEAIDKALDGTGLPSFRYRIVLPTGKIRYVQMHAHVDRDAQGTAMRMLGISMDVTAEAERTLQLQEQARDERALREQIKQQAAHVGSLLDRLKVATQAAGISTWEMSLPSFDLVWVGNRIAAFGLDEVAEEKYAAALDKLMPSEDRAAFRAEAHDAIASGRQTFSARYRLVREDGTTRHMRTYAQVVRDANGTAARLLGATTDITNEIQTTGLLQRQAEQERTLIDRLTIATEAAGISSWEIDLPTRKVLWVENPLQSVQDWGVENALEHHLANVHPDDRNLLTQQVNDAIRNDVDRISYRYRVPTATGGMVHVQLHGRLLADQSGRVVRLLGVSWDVTKEIEAAERLRQHAQMLRDVERRLERASLSSSEGHWESDLNGETIWLSSSYHALLGYRDGEMPRTLKELERFIHPDDLERGRADMRNHVVHGTPFNNDVRLLMKNGDYRWFRQRGMAERDANGRATSISGSIQDVHEQKLAEVALSRAQARFERAIKGTQDGLWEMEADGTSWCSPRVAELLGYSPDEFPSDTNFLRLFLHPDDAETVGAVTQLHFQQGLPYDVEIRLRSRGGEYRWYRARASAERGQNGQPQRLSGSLQDVTEARADREELMRATEAAQAASHAKSEFLANVSHEIRTPMNGIIGMTGLLLDTRLDRTQRDYAETIRTSADSLLIVINDILDFSKIEAGKLDIEAIDLDLRGNVEDVASMLAFQAAAKNLELVVHVHPDIPGRVIGDPQRVRQCLINLVGNAIKFTRLGEIVIEVRNAGTTDNGRILVQFEVRDTGIGVAPAILRTLFQPFVQADSSTTRHFGGTGLGLSIVRRLVEMMGGEVGARSEVDVGSSFWFTLPLQPVGQAEPAGTLDLDRLGRRVLVVDDNETNRRVLAGQLMHAGYEVSLAGGGSEAISLLRQAMADNHPFEVVLADYKMHDMDGAALGERINSDPQLSRARVVMLTSMDRHGDIHRYASLGFAAYLTKPVRARELFACLDRVLARDSKEWHLQSQPIVTRGSLVGNERRRYSGNVLLVEDNAVNQKVAVRFLERLGLKVRVADNGAEGVKAFSEGGFDMILMDLQMPVMDGFTATRRIRELENGTRQIPIVALTANAMAGQLERCLQAGMNGFLTKPLEIARLHETLDRHGLGTGTADTPGAHACIGGNTGVPVNLARLNEITDSDPEFTHELASTFIASGGQVIEEILGALTSFDRPALSRAAHKLKGASANIHAEPLRDLAYALETQAASLDQPRLKELIAQLMEEFTRAAEFLKEQAPLPTAKAG